MALSDYLTDSEWDACFYASMGQHISSNFGDSMHKTIDALLKSGYVFSGLDDSGNKKQQIRGTGNPFKVCIFLGNPHNVDVLEILDSGRRFLKEYLPSLVDETDENWVQQMKEGREK